MIGRTLKQKNLTILGKGDWTKEIYYAVFFLMVSGMRSRSFISSHGYFVWKIIEHAHQLCSLWISDMSVKVDKIEITKNSDYKDKIQKNVLNFIVQIVKVFIMVSRVKR